MRKRLLFNVVTDVTQKGRVVENHSLGKAFCERKDKKNENTEAGYPYP